MRRYLVIALVGAAACGGEPRVDVQRGDTVVLSVSVTIASSEADRARGLRGSRLEAGQGLLIELPRELDACVVNSGVEQSLDALVISEAGRVTAIERSIPAGDATARCHRARWILEVESPSASAVQPGDALVIDH